MKRNRKVKDSLFCSLLSQKKYALQAYLDLHPGSDITEDDIEIITLENIFIRDYYNDFGMSIKDQRLILIEAQSTWSYNILIRALIYFALELKKLIDQGNWHLYTSRLLPYKDPEFYVVYPGTEDVPEVISIQEVFNDGKEVNLNLKIKVIKDRDLNDFFGQYLYFCRKLEEYRSLYGDSIEAIEHTIDDCIQNHVFIEYMFENRSEVIEMLDILFDQERATRQMMEEERSAAREQGLLEGLQEGHRKGLQEGKQESQKEIALNLKNLGLEIEKISQATGLTKEEIENL